MKQVNNNKFMGSTYILHKVACANSKNWNWTGYVVAITCLDVSREYQFTEYYKENFGGYERLRRRLQDVGAKVYTLKECYPLPSIGVREWNKLSEIDLIAVNSDGTITNGDKLINNK